jgi:hypothetical protein
LADALLALRREIIDGGLIIDTLRSEIVIGNAARLDGGIIVVVSAECTTIYDSDEISDPSALIKALMVEK